MKRFADTFFRSWAIAILPIFVLPVGALFLMKSTPSVYGMANIWADRTSIQQLPYVDTTQSPAANVISYLNQLLLSPGFDLRVARQSPLYWQSLSLTGNPVDAAEADLSKNATAIAAGPNLVTITYSSKSSAVATQVIQSILTVASAEMLRLNQQQSAKTIAYDTRLLKTAQARYAAAAKSLGDYMSIYNISATQLDLRQLSDGKLASLYQAVRSAETDIENARQQLSTATLQETGIGQNSFRVIDPASSKVVTLSKKKQLMSLAIPLLLGLLLAGAFIILRTLQDRSLRYPDEVPQVLGLPVLAVVPHSPALAPASKRDKSSRLGKLASGGRG